MKYIPVILSVIAVAVMLFIFIDTKNKLHKHIIDSERKTRDSISQKITIFVAKSDSLQYEINRMNKDLTNKINSFRYDLYKIRIIQIPTVNYSNDTILISRLLSGYTGR
jgi:uncharacterized protein YoxC